MLNPESSTRGSPPAFGFSLIFLIVLLRVTREAGNTLYREYIGNIWGEYRDCIRSIFPYSLFSTSKYSVVNDGRS